MTQLSPTALEAAVKAAYDVPLSDGDPFGTLVYMSDYVRPGRRDYMRRSTMEILNTVATAAITAYLAQAGKEGWVMVPKVASDKMVCAALDDFEKRAGRQRLTHIYAAMLAAAQNGGEPCK